MEPEVENNTVENDTEAEREPITDSEGLRRAYESDSKIYVYGDAVYIAGTSSMKDVSEWPLLPRGRVTDTTRFKEALKVLEGLKTRPKLLVGHSLGASVAQSLGELTGIDTRAYATPANANDWLPAIAGGLGEAAADVFGATAGVAAAELVGPELAPFVAGGARDLAKGFSNRIVDGLRPKETRHTVRYKRPLDPVGALDGRARLAGDFRWWQHSSEGFNTASNQDVDPRCMVDRSFCTPVVRRKTVYKGDRGGKFLR
jgi:hypothetical protein